MRLVALVAVLGLVLAACGNGEGGETTTTAPAGEETTTTEMMDDTTTTAEMVDGEAVVTCLVTDLAGVDDRSFNAAAWQGVLDAVDSGAAAADPILLESDDQADYQPNIDQCIAQGAQHIVTVGFELADATTSNAEANPDITWTIVDFAIDLPNVRGLVYPTDEAAFAAGYLAAGVSTSGIVGT
jgi:basic membrane protein A